MERETRSERPKKARKTARKDKDGLGVSKSRTGGYHRVLEIATGVGRGGEMRTMVMLSPRM